MKHSNINIDRASLTGEEIQKGQDFSQLLKAHHAQFAKPWYQNPLNYVWVGSIMAVALGAWYFMTPKHQEVVPDYQVVAFAEENNPQDLIAPPMPEIDSPFSTYSVNADRGGDVSHRSSRLVIPASAFQDKEGNLVTGDVEIQYREFHDKIDVMLSGIPMDYDSAGTRYHFETGGMLEIRGYQNGEELSILPDKNLSVQMHTSVATDSEGAFNFYYLSEASRKWEYLSTAVRLNTRWSNIEKINLMAKERFMVEMDEEVKALAVEFNQAVSGINKIQDSRPIPPRKADTEAHQIELSFDEKDFPELNAYAGTLFEVDESSVAFDPNQAAKEWNNVKIKKGSGSGKYQVTFYRPGESYKVTCIPVLGDADMAAAQKVFEQKFAQYQQDLKAAEALAERIEQERQERMAIQRAQIAEAQAARQRWVEARQEVAAAENSMTNFFAVNAFGFYNCDAPRQLPKGRQYSNPRFFDTNGDVLVHGNIYLLIEGQNRVVNYYDGHQIQFDPTQKNTLVTITMDKQLAVIEDPELDALEEEDKCPIKMYVYPNKINTANDVRNVLKATSIDL